MAVTMLLLIALFLVFSFILFRVTHSALFLIVIPLGGLLVQYFLSDKMVLASAGARIVDERQAPELFGIVQRLAQQADLPMPRVALVDTAMPNAFATGRNPKHAVVAVTTGLLQQLSGRELEAVLAHEMTHIRNRDMVVMTMASSVAAVASFVIQMAFWIGLASEDDRDNGNAFLIILLVSLAVGFISNILVMALSRYREYAADRGGAILTGAPEQLASALLRISGTMQHIPNQDLRQAQPLSALYIASPRKVASEFFSDHPSVENRVARLQRLQQQMVGR